MDRLLHTSDSDHRPDGRGRLSTIGHAEAFRAFAGVAKQAGFRFMLIGGTFRDVAIRASSTRDIDVVLIDREDVDDGEMRAAGFRRRRGTRYAWSYRARGNRVVEIEIAALASSSGSEGPFSVAARHAVTTTVEGTLVSVPTTEDYVALKLIAAAADRRRTARDLADVQFALEAHPDRANDTLSVAGIRARLRDLYGIRGERLKEITSLFRAVPRQRRT